MDRNQSEGFRSITLTLHRKLSSVLNKMEDAPEDVASLLLVLELDDDFDSDINDCCHSE